MEKKYFQKQSSLFFNRLSLCPPSPRRFMRRAASEALEIGPLLKKLLLKQQLELQTKGLATRAMSNCRGISGVGGNTANILQPAARLLLLVVPLLALYSLRGTHEEHRAPLVGLGCRGKQYLNEEFGRAIAFFVFFLQPSLSSACSPRPRPLSPNNSSQATLRLALGTLQGSSCLRFRLRPPGPRCCPLRRRRRGQGPRSREACGIRHKGRELFLFLLNFNLFFLGLFDVARAAPRARRQAQLVRGRCERDAPLSETGADLLRLPPGWRRPRREERSLRRERFEGSGRCCRQGCCQRFRGLGPPPRRVGDELPG